MVRFSPRLRFTRGLARSFAALAAALIVSPFASAGLLPTSVTVNPEAGNYRWTYAVVLPTDMKLQTGNFFTIYDFGGYVAGGESAPAGWTFSAEQVGPVPALLKPTDDPALWNLTWKYDGPTIPTGQIGLGNFWAVSTFTDPTSASFTAVTNRSSDGLPDSNITETSTPVSPGTNEPPPGVPEPATLALAALGLPFVGAARFWRRKQK